MVSIEALAAGSQRARLAHALLEFCGLVGVHDPRHLNDRLLLGMKGTMSEMELSVLRQHSLEALKQTARLAQSIQCVV